LLFAHVFHWRFTRDIMELEGGFGVMAFCIHCGREVSEDAEVCPYCGKNPRVPSVPAEKRAARQASAAEVVPLVLGILGAAVVIAAGMNAASTDIGAAFVGLGMFLLAIVLFLFARASKP
jgi:hypothetical protein